MSGYVTQDEFDELKARAERMEDALLQIQQWARAYPEDIFIPPTSAQCADAHKALVAIGMSIDKFSAHAMRHVAIGCGKIATEGLGK